MRKPLLALTVLAAAGLVAAPAAMAGSPSAGAAGKCPQFRVLHNDSISGVKFPAGPYEMVTSQLSCSQSTTYFQQFLASGRVAKGWTVKLLPTGSRRFTKTGTKVDFQATPATQPTPSPTPTPSPYTCPGYFHVLHNDRIGAMSLPAGRYTITLLSNQVQLTGLNCEVASYDFAYFLTNDWSGRLPSPWYTNNSAKTFYRGNAEVGFRVQRTGSNSVLLGMGRGEVGYAG